MDSESGVWCGEVWCAAERDLCDESRWRTSGRASEREWRQASSARRPAKELSMDTQEQEYSGGVLRLTAPSTATRKPYWRLMES